MENEVRVIFSFVADGDNARIELGGTGEEVISGLIMMLDANPSMKLMMEAALKVFNDMPEDLRNSLNEKKDESN